MDASAGMKSDGKLTMRNKQIDTCRRCLHNWGFLGNNSC